VATDIYITPYLESQQITSGTLAYALGAGKACISTPYVYATEVLASNRGCLVPFKNSDKIFEKVSLLLSNNKLRERLSKRGYDYSRNMLWKNVAMHHLDLFSNSFK
jgi:glycosyltransferase involved in cell wall biosynthesis